MSILLGVAADDFTGASDVASFLKQSGLSTVLLNGIPEEIPEFKEEVNAVVIAMKTRTIPADEAVKKTLEAFRTLKKMGAKQLYFKYCATFDSTEKGNIGPVSDAVLEEYGIPYTVICPALPVNGRTVKDRILCINGVPLEKTHMKDHPLTPMRDSDLKNLMEMQSRYHAYGEDESIPEAEHYYVIPDYYEDAHGDMLAEKYADLPFFTGGSGLAGAIGRRLAKLKGQAAKDDQIKEKECENPVTDYAAKTGEHTEKESGKAILLAGSCSKVTLSQIACYKEAGYPFYQILPEKLVDGSQTMGTVMEWLNGNGSGSLIYSSQTPEEMEQNKELDREEIASLIEKTISEVAATALDKGYTRIISAGGETSGAVTEALGYKAFYIGESVAPGVPVMIPVENPSIRLILKSGGFGQEDFFQRALEISRR